MDPIRQFIAHHPALAILALMGTVGEATLVVLRSLGL